MLDVGSTLYLKHHAALSPINLAEKSGRKEEDVHMRQHNSLYVDRQLGLVICNYGLLRTINKNTIITFFEFWKYVADIFLLFFGL